jgi:hypothetical protein
MKPKLKPPGTEHLKLRCDEALSNLAFNFNLRRYSMVRAYIHYQNSATVELSSATVPGRGLHSSTSQLNLSRF